MKNKRTRKQWLWIMIGGLFLPLLSLYLASQASLFYENLTYVGNLKTNRFLFMCWGILQSLFYCVSYYHLTKQLQIYKQITFILCIVVTSISIIAFLLPYQNHSGDLVSQLHVYGSMSSCIATFLLIINMIKDLADIDFLLYETSKKAIFLLLSTFAFIIVLLGDISSLSELILLNGHNCFFILLIL